MKERFESLYDTGNEKGQCGYEVNEMYDQLEHASSYNKYFH